MAGRPVPARRVGEDGDGATGDRVAAEVGAMGALTGMAFAIFADAPVDVAVIEVGIGGTWDSTNVADGAVAVVTPISLDHMHVLGPTITDIATDKAGRMHLSMAQDLDATTKSASNQ